MSRRQPEVGARTQAPNGELITHDPRQVVHHVRNSRLLMRLLCGRDQQGGWTVLTARDGFRLPDGAILSPMRSPLVAPGALAGSHAEQRPRLPSPLRRSWWVRTWPCPSVDGGLPRVSALRRKMAAYQANGARLGLLLLPTNGRRRKIWRASGDPQRRTGPTPLEAGPGVFQACAWTLKRFDYWAAAKPPSQVTLA